MVPVRHLTQSGGDAKLFSLFADASFENHIDIEPCANVTDVKLFPFECER